jgi:hypothetical protein
MMGDDWQRPEPGRPFEFEVHRPGEPGNQTFAGDDYGICLPHQCDAWEITRSPDRETALAEARRFRAELDAAIAELES